MWGVSCKEIGADWAEQRIKGVNVPEVLRRAFFGKKKNIKSFFGRFEYPLEGSGHVYQIMADRAVACGADLMLNCKVTKYNRQNNMITSVDAIDAQGCLMEIKAKQFFSSIPLKHFFKLLNPPDESKANTAADNLRYRAHITVNLLVKKNPVFHDQWIYVHSPGIEIVKLTNYNNFSPLMSGNAGKTALSAGYFAFEGKGIWNESDEELKRRAESDVQKMGLVKAEEIEGSWVVRETEAYPIYDLGFGEHYKLLKARVDEFENFYSIGRAGMHQHNNMDYSMKSGMLAARNYLRPADKPYVIWDVNPDFGGFSV